MDVEEKFGNTQPIIVQDDVDPARHPAHECYRGHSIIIGRSKAGWWARIEDIKVELIMHRSRHEALSAAAAFLDGFDRIVH